MNLKKLQESLQEIILNIRFLNLIADFCEYIIYFVVVLKMINSFVFLGGVIDAVCYYISFLLILLAFAKKEHVALAILFVGNALCYLYEMITMISHQYFLYYSTYSPYPFWKNLFAIIINASLAGFFIFLTLKENHVKSIVSNKA